MYLVILIHRLREWLKWLLGLKKNASQPIEDFLRKTNERIRLLEQDIDKLENESNSLQNEIDNLKKELEVQEGAGLELLNAKLSYMMKQFNANQEALVSLTEQLYSFQKLKQSCEEELNKK